MSSDGSVIREERLRRLSAATRRSAAINKADRVSRDAEIAECERDGWSLREIARVADLSVSHVQKICYDAEVRRQNAV